MGAARSAKTTTEELAAFEAATRDLVGLALRSVEDLEVSLPQYRLLLVLRERGRSTSTQCAEALGVAGSSVTRLADKLDASGHLARGDDPANRSVVTLELTDAGRRIVDGVNRSRRRDLRKVLDQLDPEERATCAVALDRMHGLIAEGHGSSPAALPL